jgi:hypothetical protein
MQLKTLSLCREFVSFVRREASTVRSNHVKIGDLLLTFRLINAPDISSESKLTYAYLFFHRDDISGVKIPALSRALGMTPQQTRDSLNELISEGHIKLITTRQSADMSELTYYYAIVEPKRYGMHTLEGLWCSQNPK